MMGEGVYYLDNGDLSSRVLVYKQIHAFEIMQCLLNDILYYNTLYSTYILDTHYMYTIRHTHIHVFKHTSSTTFLSFNTLPPLNP